MRLSGHKYSNIQYHIMSCMLPKATIQLKLDSSRVTQDTVTHTQGDAHTPNRRVPQGSHILIGYPVSIIRYPAHVFLIYFMYCHIFVCIRYFGWFLSATNGLNFYEDDETYEFRNLLSPTSHLVSKRILSSLWCTNVSVAATKR